MPWLEVEDFVSEGMSVVGRPLEPSRPTGFRHPAHDLDAGLVPARHAHAQHRRRAPRPVRLQHGPAARSGPFRARQRRERSGREAALPDRAASRACARERAPERAARHDQGRCAACSRSRRCSPACAPISRAIRSSASTGRPAPAWARPVSRRYDPVYERDVVVALDAQTVPGPFWMMQYDDDLVEGLCVARDVARPRHGRGRRRLWPGRQRLHEPGRYRAPCTSHQARPTSRSSASPTSSPDISRWASLPFSTLLHSLGRRVPPSTSIVALSGRDSQDYAPVLRRLSASGRSVRLYSLGRYSTDSAAHARALGLHANVIKLEPSWRTADALKVVG